jgi:hypothetical protein
VPSYKGHVEEARPWVLQLDAEPPKPLEPANGTAAPLGGHTRIERLA